MRLATCMSCSALLCALVLGPGCKQETPAQPSNNKVSDLPAAKAPAKGAPPAGHPQLPAASPSAAAAHGSPRAKVHGAAPGAQAHGHPHGGQVPPARQAASSTAIAGELHLGALSAKVNKSWAVEVPKNAMRKAQYKIAGSKGGDASFVVFQFPGGAGAAKQNLDRWIGQFAPSAAKGAKTTTTKRGALTIHALDVQGDYQAAPMPGQDPSKSPKGPHRLLAAVIEGQGDPIYFKLLGPIPTVTAQKKAWEALLASLKIESTKEKKKG